MAMYPAPFEYYRANTVDEAVQLLGKHEGAKLLAGGHSLLPLMNLRLAQPPALIDIGRIAGLRGVAVEKDHLLIGALTSYAELATSPEVHRWCPVIAEVAAQIGDMQVRNRGTIGGSLAHADPASDMPTLMVALGAELLAQGPHGKQIIKAGEMFEGLMTTALKADQVLVSIRVPAVGQGMGAAYAKLRNPASGYAVVGVAAVLQMSGNTCRKASVVIGGVNPRPMPATAIEHALNGKVLDEATIHAASAKASQGLDEAMGDIHASADYRKAMAVVYTQRALTSAMQRAQS